MGPHYLCPMATTTPDRATGFKWPRFTDQHVERLDTAGVRLKKEVKCARVADHDVDVPVWNMGRWSARVSAVSFL